MRTATGQLRWMAGYLPEHHGVKGLLEAQRNNRVSE